MESVTECVQEPTEKNQFTYATWWIDVTGWRLIDEIFHISAEMSSAQYSSYVLPQCNINGFTERLYNIKVVTHMNGYRMLKDIKRNEIIKAKNINHVLVEFITWLEENRGTDGIILLCYEKNEKMVVILLATLERNNLLERFMDVVKGFANVYDIAKCVCPNEPDYTFDGLSLSLLKKKSERNFRANICYELFMKLVEIDGTNHEGGQTSDNTSTLVKMATKTTDDQIQKLEQVIKNLKKQNTWKPLFADAMKSDWRNRAHATRLRKVLVERNIEFDQVQSEYEKGGKDSVTLMLANMKISQLNARNIAELVDCYYNTENRIILPKIWAIPAVRKGICKTLKKDDILNDDDIPDESTDEVDII